MTRRTQIRHSNSRDELVRAGERKVVILIPKAEAEIVDAASLSATRTQHIRKWQGGREEYLEPSPTQHSCERFNERLRYPGQ